MAAPDVAVPVVVAAPVTQETAPAAVPVDTEALLSALERLAALRESGILTDAEFEQQKARILAD
ncbi:SHOCT domain-containing protein [Rhodococcus pyridinivorans]|nr:SHOCT domain-containing protein [Rhodococcus pyridinivorans]